MIRKETIMEASMLDNGILTSTFYYIALFSTILFVLKMILFAFTGGDAEVFSDFNTEFEAETSFNFLSIQSILAFLMGFGWIGLAVLNQWKLPTAIAVSSGAIFGLILMFLSSYLMLAIKKLNKNIRKDYKACIGKEAKTYTAFKAQGEGQIEVVINGKLSVEKAKNISDNEIDAFTQITITDYKDNTFYIEKI